MIQIINKAGLILDLESTSAIPVELNNPLFSTEDSLFQEVVYSAQTGWTDNNKAFTGYGYLIDASNKAFVQDVQVLIGGNPLYAGTFTHKNLNNKLSFNLKVNFGSVALKVKNTIIRDIRGFDSITTENTTAKMAALMINSCMHPEQYPFAFFPVFNDAWSSQTETLGVSYPWMNNWDHQAQAFHVEMIRTTFDTRSTIQVPFFKLSYIIKKVFEYLEFNLEGELLDDPEFNSLYLYTRRALKDFQILPSLAYLPAELTISDFLKQISDRLKINFTFNVLNNTVTIYSAFNTLQQSRCTDLSAYVQSIDEISTDEGKGYTVTLKVDQDDEAMNIAPEDKQAVFKPTYTLIVGGGENPLELQVSTLKSKSSEGYAYPVTRQRVDLVGEEVNTITWPIKLLRFTGMKQLPSGKVFPQADPVDLTDRDAVWYRFLNDSKRVVAIAKVPDTVLPDLTTLGKIGLVSREQTFTYALPKQISYSLTNRVSERTPVKIDCRTLVHGYTTPYSIKAAVYSDEEENGTQFYKAYFSEAPGINKVDFELYYEKKRTGTDATTGVPFTEYASILESTDKFGVGGSKTYIPLADTVRRSIEELRIRTGLPKYIVRNGKQVFFIKGDGYYYVSIKEAAVDGQGVWIVF